MMIWTDSIDGVDWHELSELYRLAPLGDKPPEWLQRAFSNSMFVCLVREHGRIAGAGRAVADGVDCAYLCDIAVLPDQQGKGLGKAIVQRLRKIILYAVPGREPVYARFGFRRMRTAMAIFADPAQAERSGYLDHD